MNEILRCITVTAILLIMAGAGWQPQLTAASGLQTAVTSSGQEARNYFNETRSNGEALRAFIRRMPKGAELHTHLSGIPTPERLLELAGHSQLYHYFVRVPLEPAAADDAAAYALVAERPALTPKPEAGFVYVPVSALLQPDTDTRRAQFLAYRRANMIAENEPYPLDVFYGAIFARRAQVVNSAEMVPLMINDAIKQAHQDRVSYLELQLSPFPMDPLSNANEVNRVINLSTAREYLTTLIAAVRAANEAWPANERVEVKFILAFSRTNNRLFLYLPIAFELAAGSDAIANAIAGINLVGNEYSQDIRIGQAVAGPENLRDYVLTLHRVYPRVRLSIHAGEGTRWDWHIRDSILMGAERIGHATNLALSPDAVEPELLRRQRVLVEACLTSNHLLLGVPLNGHPFIKYHRAGIAVSLNSDDAGVFNTNMSEEFARAAENYPDLSWDELKQLARASLEHAFVAEDAKRTLIERWENDMRAFEASKDWRQWLK